MSARPAIIFGIAFTSTLLGSVSGGSSSLLTTPSWVAMGFPLPTAVGADKVAGAFWTLFGSRNYLRSKPVEWPLVVGMMVTGVIGAWLGTAVTTSLDPRLLRRVVGGIILAVVAVFGFRRRHPARGDDARGAKLPTAAVVAAGFPLGFYEGVLGSGNSIFATVLLRVGRGFDVLRALGHYYVVAAAWCAFAAIGYWNRGYFDLGLAGPATLGAIAGGWLGSHLGNRFGPRVVGSIFLVAGAVMGSKLLFGW